MVHHKRGDAMGKKGARRIRKRRKSKNKNNLKEEGTEERQAAHKPA
jgi:hypothetical protein